MIFFGNHSTLRTATETSFVVRRSKGHHLEGFCPYFHVFKLAIAPEVYASTRHTSLMVKNYGFNFFSISLSIQQNTKKYCINTLPIILKLFFSKSPEKVGFLEKKVRPNPTHTALCGGVPNLASWEHILEKKRHPLILKQFIVFWMSKISSFLIFKNLKRMLLML